ncbi:acetyl-CoA carboxylase biotin carboxylase subunit [Caenibius tardaugens]|nr:acetyl/propionyl/methylcrotonyl-CoA carboxylase subunit alpha [Caenibius tardaugens]AZI38142.1 acetyl/propionyl/methylcrotonyl-CoA carboxylase subunit alpha [Caenibius tardaugens NBRC 16725]
MIGSLLIANRGEIACRIIRTARRMGIRTIAVYSDADAQALHVRSADEAVSIGPSPPRESYLAGDKILAAAKQTGAEAIHPGYGFLSENAEFAQAVLDAGLVWVGPKPKSITATGLKDAAKKLMQDAGVPTTPGYLGENQDPAHLASEAGKIGYPVLIKAVAGGGGKGMRLVEKAEDFSDALASCQREAASSFGNAHVLIEKYIVSPRHIEVQVFGDSHGNVVHLFERDCSLQRRHQKVIEEAPAPGMDPVTRAAICAAAVRAAKAVDYEGAGTIEFIADGSEGLRADHIWFMEMNTRLQVEHPVTEEITGQDLVEWQLRVASGEPLPKQQEDLSINGWAVEARLYAEDPGKGFLPSTGRLDVLRFGDAPGGRIDTGVYEQAEVSPFYDPMIAKVIAHGATRDQAIARLGDMLEGTAVYPVKTNAAFLVKALAHPQFRAGTVETGLIGRDGEAMAVPPIPSEAALGKATIQLVPNSAVPGFRLNAAPRRRAQFLLDGEAMEIALTGHGVDHPAESTLVTEKGQVWLLSPWRKQGTHGAVIGDGAIVAPMPGKIIAVDVRAGQNVTKGQKLLTLEAMKMEYTLTAPFDGTVTELQAVTDAQVQVDALLAKIAEKAA